MRFQPRHLLPLGLLLVAVAAPAQTGRVELALTVSKREFTPDEPVRLQLRNGSSRPLFLIVERLPNVRTEKKERFPGVPVHERRKRKFFFRSDRWVYLTGGQARFAGALLKSGDAISFDTRIPQPANYRIYVRYWWVGTPEQEKELMRLDMKALEEKHADLARWLNTPTFRVKPAPPPQPASKAK